MLKQSSHDSGYGEDSTLADLNRNEFSISITEAKIKQDESQSQGGYLTGWKSLVTSSSSSYGVFKIETQSMIQLYGSPHTTHSVWRRFSDFEYLLNKLLETEDLKNCCFPSLPEKQYFGSLDEGFIQKRRHELEGFLRVLITTDQRVKENGTVFAFLTYEESKFKEFKQNPGPFLDKIKNFYSYVPDVSDLKNKGIQQTAKQWFTRVKTEIEGVEEPRELVDDSGNLNFDDL